MRKAKVAVLVGGKSKASNMAALVRASQAPDSRYEVEVVIVPSSEAPAIETCRAVGAAWKVVEPSEDYEAALLDATEHCDFICLAGYLRLLPEGMLSRFNRRVLNIHPALLPKFGGKGMYGMHVHRAVLAAGEAESGCTVHLVTEVYDEGPILRQAICPVLPDDTPESLAQRVLALEHEAYPSALNTYIAQEFDGD